MEKMKVTLRLGIGNPVLVQYPAHLAEDTKLEDNVHSIPTVNMRLQKITSLDDYFAYFEDGSKIERYRIPKIFIGKEAFESEEFSPLRISEEDKLRIEGGK